MTAPEAAWKHRVQTAGYTGLRTPDSFGYGVNIFKQLAYTGAELTTISVRDLNYVQRQGTADGLTTIRANHMFRVDASVLTQITNIVDFGHFVDGVDTSYTMKMYIRNNVAGSWEQIDTSTATGQPRTMGGTLTADLSDYLDGSNKIYLLLWDYEGVYNAVCLHESTLIHTPAGKVPLPDLRTTPRHQIVGWQDSQDVERDIDEITIHPRVEYSITTIETADAGSVKLTDNHLLPTVRGEIPAGQILVGDAMVKTGGRWTTVVETETTPEVCKTYDVGPKSDCFWVNDGLLVKVMHR